jgi:hypothetical protein
MRRVSSAWANPKTGEIQAILTKEQIDATNANPPTKGFSKACRTAYVLELCKINWDLDTKLLRNLLIWRN